MYMDMSKILKVIQPDSNFNVNVSFNITYPVSNVYGKSGIDSYEQKTTCKTLTTNLIT